MKRHIGTVADVFVDDFRTREAYNNLLFVVQGQYPLVKQMLLDVGTNKCYCFESLIGENEKV